MLSIENLTLHYGGSQILHGITLEAAQGEVTCVMGTNGVGKTSLMKAISGTHPRSGGSGDAGRRGAWASCPRMRWRARAWPMCRRGERSFRC